MTGDQERAPTQLHHVNLTGPLRPVTQLQRHPYGHGLGPLVVSRPLATPLVLAGNGGADLVNPPDAGVPQPVTLSNSGGAVAAGSPVQLIFWGNEWSDPGTSPSAAQIVADVQSILAGPWRAGLRQYGVGRIPFGGAVVVSNRPPPASFNVSDVAGLILTLLDGGTFIKGELNLFVVMMPPSSSYAPGGVTGTHFNFFYPDPLLGDDPGWAAFVLFSSESSMTTTFTHELAEMVTDPEGTAWQVEPRNSGPGGSWNEIGDICQATTKSLAGVTVQGYWSVDLNSCVVPTAPSVRTTLRLAGITLAGNGLRAIENPVPSLNSLIDRLFGSTL